MVDRPLPPIVDLPLSQMRRDPAQGLIQLALWRAFLLATPRRDGPAIHIVGVNMRNGRSRVSSPVTRINASARCVATESGRVYELVGERGRADIAFSLLQRLTDAWHAAVVADVTGWLFDVQASSPFA